jgi:signal transduction histidine kinase
VLGYAFTFGEAASEAGDCVLHPVHLALVQPAGDDDTVPAFQASGALCSLPELATAAGASGFLNVVPDPDGTIRRAPLVVAHAGAVYPGLALAAVAAASGVRAIDLQSPNANTTWLRLDDQIVPLDGKSNLLLRYRGKKRTFPFASADDVLSGRVPAGAFTNKIVFIGTTALGIQEDVATPLDTRFTGVEVQATIAENLLQRDFIRRPEHAVAAEIAMLALGLFGVWLTWARGPATGIAGSLGGCVLMWVVAAGLLSRAGVFLSPLLPTAALLVALPAAVIVAGADVVTRATTSVRRARQQAVVARSAKHEILSKVSHELRTPLAAVYGWAQLLGSGVLKEEQRRAALATITQNLRVHNRMIDDLLDMSRVTKGDLRLQVCDVDIANVLHEVVGELRPAVDAKHLRLELWLDPAVGTIPGDPGRLHQIAFNLLSNAIAFTPPDGTIRMELAPADAHVQIVVSDSGMGITPEFLPHVFEEFRQQHDGTTRTDVGLGLGLSITRHLVELHGGSLTATSSGEGRGATFCVLLPAAAHGIEPA